MKYLALLLTITFGTARAQVQWESDIQKAVEKAGASGKLLFVEAYLPTCPACQAMEPNFADQAVAERFNAGFVNYKMDLSVQGARKFLDDRKIELPSFPQFLFFDAESKLVHQGEAHPTPASVLEVAADALDPHQWSSRYKARFEKGDRDIAFLVKLGAYTRLTMDTLYNHKVTDTLFAVFPKEDLGGSLGWGVMKKVVTHTENGFFKYWIDRIPEAAALEKAAGHSGYEMNALGGIVQRTIFDPASKNFNVSQVNLLQNYMEKVGAAAYVDAFLWEHRMRAWLREGDEARALSAGEKAAAFFKENGPSLIYVTHVFNDHFPGTAYVASGRNWLKTARPLLKQNAYLAEYHYELSRLNTREGNSAEAGKNAGEALRLARLAGIDTARFEANAR